MPQSWRPPQLAGATEEELRTKVDEFTRAVLQEKSKREETGRKTKKPAQLEEPEFRYCVHCKAFKPERTHHCRECERCVLMMDHHW